MMECVLSWGKSQVCSIVKHDMCLSSTCKGVMCESVCQVGAMMGLLTRGLCKVTPVIEHGV